MRLENILKGTENNVGEFSQVKFWEVKKKVFRTSNEPPTAMHDNNGNLISSSSSLKQLFMNLIDNTETVLITVDLVQSLLMFAGVVGLFYIIECPKRPASDMIHEMECEYKRKTKYRNKN